MAAIIRFLFASDMLPPRKTSAPNRMGTRINSDFLKVGSSFFFKMILEINSLTALEPMSIAAYFFISIKAFGFNFF